MVQGRAIKDRNIISMEVAGMKLLIAKEVLRRALNIKGTLDHFFNHPKGKDIQPFVEAIGHNAKWTMCVKKHLPPYWTYLFHIVANCLSEQKEGFDKLRTYWVGIIA